MGTIINSTDKPDTKKYREVRVRAYPEGLAKFTLWSFHREPDGMLRGLLYLSLLKRSLT